MNKIVLDEQAELTAKQIGFLEERRNSIYEALEGLYQAVQQLMRSVPDYADLEPFLVQSHTTSDQIKQGDRDAVSAQAFRVYLKREGDNMGIRPEAAAQALGHTPQDVADVIKAWERYDEGPSTTDPHKYWSATKQRFRAMPVTEKEKEGIAVRNQIYVESEERKKLVEAVEGQVMIFNYASDHFNVYMTPGLVKQSMPWLAPLLAWKQKDREGYGPKFDFRVSTSKLCKQDLGFVAFDEK